MLNLSRLKALSRICFKRKKNEGILVGDDVLIRVDRVTRSAVVLAIQTPRHVRVLRMELAERLEAAEQSAVQPPVIAAEAACDETAPGVTPSPLGSIVAAVVAESRAS